MKDLEMGIVVERGRVGERAGGLVYARGPFGGAAAVGAGSRWIARRGR
jgi:hypothetical protein